MVKEERRSTIYHRKIPNRKTHSTRYSLSLHGTFAQARQTWHIGKRRALSVLGYVVYLQSLFRLAHFLCSFFCLFVSCLPVRKMTLEIAFNFKWELIEAQNQSIHILVYRLHTIFSVQSIFHGISQYKSILFRQRSESLLERIHNHLTQVYVYSRNVRMTRGTFIKYYFFTHLHLTLISSSLFHANRFCVRHVVDCRHSYKHLFTINVFNFTKKKTHFQTFSIKWKYLMEWTR